MRTALIPALALPLLLAACEMTPRQQCEAPFRGELRTVIAETKAVRTTLSRGFRLVPARWEHGLHYCLNQFDRVTLCRAEDGLAMYDKRPINRAAERAKLAALQTERQRLNTALARCAAEFPE